MSYKSVNTSIASINLQSGGSKNLNTTNVNSQIYDYEEIDYSQDVSMEEELNTITISELKENYGDYSLKYIENGEIVISKIKDSTYYLDCSEQNYNYYINSFIKTLSNEEVVNSTAKYYALYNYINSNDISLDSESLERLKKLSSIYEEYKEKLENIKPTKLSYKEEVQGLLNILNKELESVNEKIKPLQEEYNTNYQIIINPVLFNPNGINDKALESCNKIRPELDALKEQKAMLETYIYQMEHELALAPYKDISDTNDYKRFINNYNNNYQNIDYEELANCLYDPNMYIANQARGKSQKEIDAMLARGENQLDRIAIVEHLIEMAPEDKTIDFLTTFYPHFTNDFINYQFMTQEQRDMYHYLFAKKGEEEANKYLDIISDSINQAHGAKMASDFISTLDLNDKGKLEKSLANFMGVSTKGLSDGINTFFAGIENVFVNNENITADEYQKMIVLQYLKENSNYYDEIYTFNSALGNMVPSITTSAVVTLLATPAAGSIVGSSLMGLSAGGNAKHQALTEGNSLLSSWLYGIFVGGSEATLGYFLGKIPGISQTSGFTLKNLLCEGTEEFLQEWIDAGLQAVVLGSDVKWEEIPKQSADSFIMGVLMAGFLNGGQAIVNISINGIVQEINIQKTLKLLEDNPSMSAYEAMIEASGIDPLSITDTTQYLQNQSSLESIVTNQEFLNTQLDGYCEETDITVQTSLSATATMVSIKELQMLLLSDEALNKFNDFNNNKEFFNSSKDSYILAIEEYYKILKDNGCTITDSMQKRYDIIMAQSNKINSFNDCILGDNYTFYLYGNYRGVTVDYLNSIIFDENNYNRFFQIINNQTDRTSISDLTAPFFSLYQQLLKDGIIMDPVVEQRMLALNNVYVNVRNSYRTALSQYSYYGADQHAIQNVARNPASNQALYAQMEAIAQRYFPDLSKSKINKLLRATDTKGICSYATVANEILLNFNDNPDLFKQCFGFDMYRMENGQKVLNDELLLTDLYCFANQNNSGIIRKAFFGFGYHIAKNDANQNYMSLGSTAIHNKNISTINAWLQSKGVNFNWHTDLLCMRTANDVSVPLNTDNITGYIQNALLKGHTIELDAFGKKDAPMDLTLYTLDGTKYPDYKLSDGHDYGHSMTVTGITETGDIIVASWGREYKLKWSELSKVGLTINESYLQ